MKEIVEVIAKALVDQVIGRQGRIAKAIRSVVKAASSREEYRVDVDIQN